MSTDIPLNTIEKIRASELQFDCRDLELLLEELKQTGWDDTGTTIRTKQTLKNYIDCLRKELDRFEDEVDLSTRRKLK